MFQIDLELLFIQQAKGCFIGDVFSHFDLHFTLVLIVAGIVIFAREEFAVFDPTFVD